MIDDGSLTGTPGFPIINTFDGDINIDYKAHGPFLGGTYGFIINGKGILSLNLAVAYLKGDLTQSGTFMDTRTGDPNEEILDLDSSGDSVGISYGIGWSGNISESIGYSFAFSGYNYNFENDDQNKSDFTELSYQFSVGLTYVF